MAQKTPFGKKILIIEDHDFVGVLIQETLTQAGYSHIDRTADIHEGKQWILDKQYDLLFVDHLLKQHSGLELLGWMGVQKIAVPLIMMMESGNVDGTLHALKLGALDVLEKPLSPKRIINALEKALDFKKVRVESIQDLKEEEFAQNSYHGLIGKSSAMKKIFSLIEKISESSVSILICGPSGVGKEKIAHALHNTSARSKQKFVAINCSAIPDALLEGELFGYKRGAFTDARTNKMGLFQEAEKGTLFLDEIGDMPLPIQPKILRALQEKEIRPLGSIQTVHVDVRIIAATNQNLIKRIEDKSFREDLYYRLNAMEIDIPPLRERPEDLPILMEYFFEQFRKTHNSKLRGFSPRARSRVLEYAWPGNIRELENIIERATLLAQGEWIQPDDLLINQISPINVVPQDSSPMWRSLEEIEKEYIIQVLDAVGGNRTQTAEILRIGRKTLYNKLARYGIE